MKKIFKMLVGAAMIFGVSFAQAYSDNTMKFYRARLHFASVGYGSCDTIYASLVADKLERRCRMKGYSSLYNYQVHSCNHMLGGLWVTVKASYSCAD